MLEQLLWFGIINLISFLFYFVVLMRVTHHVKPFHFHETRETKLFGVITLRTVFIIYFFILLASLILQLMLLFPF